MATTRSVTFCIHKSCNSPLNINSVLPDSFKTKSRRWSCIWNQRVPSEGARALLAPLQLSPLARARACAASSEDAPPPICLSQTPTRSIIFSVPLSDYTAVCGLKLNPSKKLDSNVEGTATRGVTLLAFIAWIVIAAEIVQLGVKPSCSEQRWTFRWHGLLHSPISMIGARLDEREGTAH